MRILHTADLHLGRQFHGLSLAEDQAAVLDQMVAALRDTRADALIIAGDIFDRANPPQAAIEMFNDFLRRVLARTSAAVILLAGNHDSGVRIDMMSVFAEKGRALVRGVASACERPLILEDAHGKVAFSALPFTHEHAARVIFSDGGIDSPSRVIAAQVAAARAEVPAGARWVVAAHAFVRGGEAAGSERALTRLGGIETVGADVFAGAHYVALGHLHRAQEAGAARIRYAGAPLAFDFSEHGEKSMTLVELDAKGQARVTHVPFTPPRKARVIRGTLDELLELPPSEDFIRAELTDDVPRIDPMRRLRQLFPHVCQLEYVRHMRAPEVKGAAAASLEKLHDPLAVVEDFLRLLRQREEGRGASAWRGMTDGEREVVRHALRRLHEGEAE